MVFNSLTPAVHTAKTKCELFKREHLVENAFSKVLIAIYIEEVKGSVCSLIQIVSNKS